MSYWFEQPHTLVYGAEFRHRLADGYQIHLLVDLTAEKSLAGLTTMALHRRIKVFDQCLSVERLTEEAGCSGFRAVRPARRGRDRRSDPREDDGAVRSRGNRHGYHGAPLRARRLGRAGVCSVFAGCIALGWLR